MKSYLITDPDLYGDTVDDLTNSLTKALNSHKVDLILFRDKKSKDIRNLALSAKETADSYGIPILMSGDIDLALDLEFKGIHLRSNQKELVKEARQSFDISAISTHTLEEALLAQQNSLDFITYSPIFDSPNKGRPKGLSNLNEILDKIKIDCFALGGIITQEHIDAVLKTKACGFASIRYFIN